MKDNSTEDEILGAFTVFDKEGSGRIAREELKFVLEHLGEKLTPEETQELLDEADINGDGSIDYRAYCKILVERSNEFFSFAGK